MRLQGERALRQAPATAVATATEMHCYLVVSHAALPDVPVRCWPCAQTVVVKLGRRELRISRLTVLCETPLQFSELCAEQVPLAGRDAVIVQAEAKPGCPLYAAVLEAAGNGGQGRRRVFVYQSHLGPLGDRGIAFGHLWASDAARAALWATGDEACIIAHVLPPREGERGKSPDIDVIAQFARASDHLRSTGEVRTIPERGSITVCCGELDNRASTAAP